MNEHQQSLPRSSHLKSAVYSEGTLKIQFAGGETYEWQGVSEKEHEALLQAPSPGAFLHGHIEKWHGKGRKLKR